MISRFFKSLLMTLLIYVYVYPQSTYYIGTEDLSGPALKSVLHSKIKGHKRFPYTSSGTDTWDILKLTDKDTSNCANVLLIYSGLSVNAAQEYNNANGWTREHVWAKSHGFPNESDTAYTDTHHLRPEKDNVNSARGNKDFDYGGSPYTSIPGTFTDSDSWEPRDAVKGDVARIMFYMAVRYQGPSYNLELVDYTGTPNQAIFGKLSTLLEWNRLDPPSDFERNRNDVIQSFQLNRNPFIDRPEFVDLIYNSDKFIIIRAEALSYNRIVITFNQDVDTPTAEMPSNYFIDKSIGTPVSVTKGYEGSNRKVVLTLSKSLSDQVKYIVRVNNLKSSLQTQIIPNSLASLSTDVFVPVELISFSANVFDMNVKLNWSTATEVNNYGFEILRSAQNDNADWTKVGFVEGHGNSNSAKQYSYVDNSVRAGQSYSYRLKQIDFDGQFEYSKVVNVEVGVPMEYSLAQNYPNPFNPSTSIEYTVPSNEYVTLKVYDVLGNTVSTVVNENKEAGKYNVMFDASNLTSGIYFYSIQAGKFNQVKKMMLVK